VVLVRCEVKGGRLLVGGKPVFLVGVNYWPRRHPIWKMWKEFDEREIEGEARQMAEIGINAVRCFVLAEDFSKGPYRINEEAVEKLRKLIRIFRRHGVYVLPSLFVGHMSGEDFEIPWRQGKDFYRDGSVLELEAWFLREVIGRLRGEEGVLAWILSNELPLYAGRVDPDTAEAYVRHMSCVVKSIDPDRPFTTGDGHLWPGFFPPERIVGYVDYFGPHVYTQELDAVRQTYSYGFAVKYCSSLGRPAVLEEFGCSTVYVSEENQACLFRLALFGALMNGGSGALGWCFSDFPTEDIRPYVHHHFELNFGVTRADGSEKPAASAIRRFRALVDKLDLAELEPLPDQAAILVPSCLYVDYPYTSVDRSELMRLLLECFTLAKMAHVPVTFVRETEPLDSLKRYKLVICPPAPMLLATTWSKLKEYVRSGGALYLSYRWFATRLDSELLGFEHDVKYGVPDVVEGDLVRIKALREFGGLPAGAVVEVPISGDAYLRSYCPIKELKTAEAVGEWEDKVMVATNRLGDGLLTFVAAPLELLALGVPRFHERSNLHDLYSAVASEAGVKRVVDVRSPFVEVAAFRGSELLIFLLNHLYSEVTTSVRIAGKVREVRDFESGEELKWEAVSGGAELRVHLRRAGAKVLSVSVE